ncbi:signal transduction histidine kinase [Paenibacillus endophyticus]|uniref:histidine kinase n=1 Tax=Paenibacillus endophyticus TaxID=1294268 RepID=A0A7W5C6B9_9BACL|nr:sensor histidine kinase [Paenibacillus endophyticus]MBB3151590.1 signal transduction histidine kinase [Paenibacillus endophyticus]
MLFYFIALFTAGAIVFANRPRSESNRWASYFLLAASIGGIAARLNESGFSQIAYGLQFLNYTVTPYCVLIFSLVYANKIQLLGIKGMPKLYAALPILLMLVFTVLSNNQQWFFNLLLFWSAPYYLVSCYILVISFWKERDSRLRRNRFITAVIIVPTLLAVLFFIYVAKVISPDFEFFNYISVFMIYSLVVALLCTFMYGVLGVRLRIEHDPMEGKMRAVNSGTSMLNHTIKNEIGKIAISSENLQSSLPDSNEQAKQDIKIIMNASNHMLAMMERIHSQIKDIVLKEESVSLAYLVENTLKQHEALLLKQNIILHAEYTLKPVILCDPTHISEAIGNLLLNAAEAMQAGGNIAVKLSNHKYGIELSVHDNGIGISEELLGQVFDPFFSSGKSSRNFGLGLSYVYNVINKSGAKITMTSKAGEGTTAAIIWPRRKVIAFSKGGSSE